jgi:hypothetical protein
MNARTVAVKPDETPTEVMAAAIVEISKAVREMRAGRLNDKALVLLISHYSGESQRVVKSVLLAIENLEREYVRPRKPS